MSTSVTTDPAISTNDIRTTYDAIGAFIRRTPTLSWTDDDAPDRTALLKLEQLQHSGSFKVRGAMANLVLRHAPRDGVVAASGGNHGAAVAYAARRFGVAATIFVPTISSPAKIERIRSYGANLVVTGNSYSDALEASRVWSAHHDALPIHAFDQRETILGQATLGLELESQEPTIQTVIAAVGGGGLLAGIAAWYGRRARIVGAEPELAPTLTHALDAGKPVDAPVGSVAADSLAPRAIGDLNFGVLQPVIHGTALVSDQDIVLAQRYLWDRLRIVAEPGGATAFAALLSGAYVPREGERVAIVIGGGNTTAVQL